MAALASSLIRQKRAVKDDHPNRPVASKRKPCPKSNKSLCQKQILVLISKVRLCGGRKGHSEKRPGESPYCVGLFFLHHKKGEIMHLNITVMIDPTGQLLGLIDFVVSSYCHWWFWIIPKFSRCSQHVFLNCSSIVLTTANPVHLSGEAR